MFFTVSSLTQTSDSISRVSRVTRAVERALGVGAVGVRVTVMGKVVIIMRQSISIAFIDVYRKKSM